MAAIEFAEETRQQAERIGSADIVIGLAGSVPADELRTRAAQIIPQLGPNFASLRIVVAWPSPGAESAGASPDLNGSNVPTFFPFTPPAGSTGDFWAPVSAHQRAVLALAASLNARICAVLGPDLAALEAHTIQLFAYAVLERQCGLVMPIYSPGKYDALINTGILSPLHRALYGKRIRFPLAFDFAVSGSVCSRLAGIGAASNHNSNALLWPVTVAATDTSPIAVGQIHLDAHHQAAAGGLDLSAVLSQLAGSLFQEMDACAAHWQRIRGSQPSPIWGNAPSDAADGQTIDSRPMLDSFVLGSKNLDEVWRLVLPPNTLLELRRLTRLPPEQFLMPDELWAGIVYDFALAWRLRTISRAHLLGALTPLYLGWVASWVGEVSSLTRAAAEQRFEKLAHAWEDRKPYLLSRWRWPDRFNP